VTTHLQNAGFDVIAVDDRTAFAYAFFEKTMAAATGAPSPLGVHLVMGPDAKQKIANLRANMDKGRVAPVLIMATRQ
jgi:hypothetical protein